MNDRSKLIKYHVKNGPGYIEAHETQDLDNDDFNAPSPGRNLAKCAVRTCANTLNDEPCKIFFPFPDDRNLRAPWYRACGLDVNNPPKYPLYCCEEHFDLKRETKVAVLRQVAGTGGVIQNLLKDRVVPHRQVADNPFWSTARPLPSSGMSHPQNWHQPSTSSVGSSLEIRPSVIQRHGNSDGLPELPTSSVAKIRVKTASELNDPKPYVSKRGRPPGSSRTKQASQGSVYKECVVPHCPKNARTFPHAEFVCCPLDLATREIWCNTIGRSCFKDPALKKETLFFCTDHFQPSELESLKLPRDAKLIGIRPKHGVIPTLNLGTTESIEYPAPEVIRPALVVTPAPSKPTLSDQTTQPIKVNMMDEGKTVQKKRPVNTVFPTCKLYEPKSMPRYPECKPPCPPEFQCSSVTVVEYTRFYSHFYSLHTRADQNEFIFSHTQLNSENPFPETPRFMFYVDVNCPPNPVPMARVCAFAFATSLSIDMEVIIGLLIQNIDRVRSGGNPPIIPTLRLEPVKTEDGASDDLMVYTQVPEAIVLSSDSEDEPKRTIKEEPFCDEIAEVKTELESPSKSRPRSDPLQLVTFSPASLPPAEPNIVSSRSAIVEGGKTKSGKRLAEVQDDTSTSADPGTCVFESMHLCSRCLAQFKSRQKFEKHEEEQTCKKYTGTYFNCETCGRTYYKFEDLRVHTSVVHKYICPKCSDTFRFRRYLEDHVIKCSGTNKLSEKMRILIKNAESKTDAPPHKKIKTSSKMFNAYVKLVRLKLPASSRSTFDMKTLAAFWSSQKRASELRSPQPNQPSKTYSSMSSRPGRSSKTDSHVPMRPSSRSKTDPHVSQAYDGKSRPGPLSSKKDSITSSLRPVPPKTVQETSSKKTEKIPKLTIKVTATPADTSEEISSPPDITVGDSDSCDVAISSPPQSPDLNSDDQIDVVSEISPMKSKRRVRPLESSSDDENVKPSRSSSRRMNNDDGKDSPRSPKRPRGTKNLRERKKFNFAEVEMSDEERIPELDDAEDYADPDPSFDPFVERKSRRKITRLGGRSMKYCESSDSDGGGSEKPTKKKPVKIEQEEPKKKKTTKEKEETKCQFICGICTAPFAGVEGLRTHHRNSERCGKFEPGTIFKCEPCGKVFIGQTYLDEHRGRTPACRIVKEPMKILTVKKEDTKKQEEGSPASVTSSTKDYDILSCSTCEKMFSSMYLLVRHIKTSKACCNLKQIGQRSYTRPYHSSAPYVCKGCKVQFNSGLGLGLHLKRSQKCMGDNPSVDIPGSMASSKGEYTNEKRDPKLDTVYVCTKCFASFSSVWGLRTHERSSKNCKPDRPYEIPVPVTKEKADQMKKDYLKKKAGEAPEGDDKADSNQSSGFLMVYSPETADGRPIHGKFQCGACKATFTSIWGVRTHQRMASNCKNGSYITSVGDSKKTISKAAANSIAQGENVCPNCGAKFSTAWGLRTHLRNSSICSEDSTGTYQKIEVRANAKDKVQVGTGAFLCPQCPKNFKLPTSLEQHFVEHATGDTWVCCKCEGDFADSIELHGHFRNKHAGDWFCIMCNDNKPKVMGAFQEFYAHIFEYHAKDAVNSRRYFKCLVCYRSFLSKSSLDLHVSHCHKKAEQTFACASCSKVFTKKIHIMNHLKYAHENAVIDVRYQFKCPKCPRKFMSEADWKEKHHKEGCEGEELICEVCGGLFIGKEKFSTHAKLCHSESSKTDAISSASDQKRAENGKPSSNDMESPMSPDSEPKEEFEVPKIKEEKDCLTL